MSLRPLVRDFQRDGYVVIPGLLSIAVVNKLRSIWSQKNMKSEPNFIVGNEISYEYPNISIPILANSHVLDLAERLMGPQVQLDSVAVTGIMGDECSGISWHRDLYARMPRGNAYQYPNSVHLLVYLQDMDDAVGPLRVIKGSHRRAGPISEENRHQPHADEFLVQVRSGDGVLIHNQLLHSRSPNRSKRDRLLFSVVYSLTCMRTTFDFAHSTNQSLIEQFRNIGDARLLRLFGQDDYFDEKYNCGFIAPESNLWNAWLRSYG